MSEIKKILRKHLFEQEDEMVDVSPEHYIEYMTLGGFVPEVCELLNGNTHKPLRITGDLNLKGQDVSTLKGIGEIIGNLNIEDTKVVDVSFIKINGRLSAYGSAHHRREMALIESRKHAEIAACREDREWDEDSPNLTTQGQYVNAVVRYICNSESIDKLTPEDEDRLDALNIKLEELQERFLEEPDNHTLISDIEVTEEEISELKEKISVYDIYPSRYNYEVLTFDDLEGYEYEAITEGAAKERVVDMLDDDGLLEGFPRNYLQYHIDKDAIKTYAEELYNEDVYNSPESYFDDIDEYDDDFDKRVEEKIEEAVDQAMEDVMEFMDNFGLELKDYVDKKSLAESWISDDGYGGALGSYDGNYEEYDIDGTTVIVYRTN